MKIICLFRLLFVQYSAILQAQTKFVIPLRIKYFNKLSLLWDDSIPAFPSKRNALQTCTLQYCSIFIGPAVVKYCIIWGENFSQSQADITKIL